MSTTNPSTVRMIDASEVATILNVSTRTVWRLVSSGELPEPIRFGGNVRWLKDDIEAWLEARAAAAAERRRARRKLP